MVQAVNSLNSIICLGLVYVQVQDLLNDNYILSFGEQKTAYFFIAYTVYIRFCNNGLGVFKFFKVPFL